MKKIILLTLLLFLLITVKVFAETCGTGPLLYPYNFTYLGAFRVPQGNQPSSNSSCTNNNTCTYSYGGLAIAYYPTDNSLFITGDIDRQWVGEISIPSPVNACTTYTTPTAAGVCTNFPISSLSSTASTSLQNPADISVDSSGKTWLNIKSDQSSYNNNYAYVGSSGTNVNISQGILMRGLTIYNNQLLGSVIGEYDLGGSGGGTAQQFTHFLHPLTVYPQSNTFTGFYQVTGEGVGSNNNDARMIGGYMTPIPSECQAALGGPYLTGQGVLSIASSISDGPSAYVFDPSRLGIDNPVAATPLLYYPENRISGVTGNHDLGCVQLGNCNNNYVYEATSPYINGASVVCGGIMTLGN